VVAGLDTTAIRPQICQEFLNATGGEVCEDSNTARFNDAFSRASQRFKEDGHDIPAAKVSDFVCSAVHRFIYDRRNVGVARRIVDLCLSIS
jgi:hypothetical protein